MFSGIVAGTGKIISLKSNKDFMTLKVDPPKGFCKGLQKHFYNGHYKAL